MSYGLWSDMVEVGPEGRRSVVVWRDGRGVPMVLCHSVTLDHRMWEPVVTMLPTGIPVLAYDVRGHGPGRYGGSFSFQSCADDLRSHLDNRGIDRVHLVGVSMGGAIAQQFAITFGDRLRMLTLFATGAKGRARGRNQGPVTSRAELAARVAPTIARWLTPAFISAGGPWVDYVRNRVAGTDPALWNDAWAALGDRDLTSSLGRIGVPTVCVAATEDTSTPVSRLVELASLIPRARLIEIAGPHLSPIERPDAVAALLGSIHTYRK